MANNNQTNQTCNTDIDGLVRRANRVIFEISRSQSSNVSQTISFDVTRSKSYVDGLRRYIQHVVSQPLLDLPETGPTLVDLPPKIVIPAMENESSYDMCVMVKLLVDEASDSQSSRLPSNFIPFDTARFNAILDKMDAFINNFITVVDPLDLPESSPGMALTPSGLRGI